MADTNPTGNIPVEGDGVSYPGIGWFLVVLIATVVACQVFIWGWFQVTAYYRSPDAVRAPLAAPAAEPRIEAGQVVTGTDVAGPAILVREPVNLGRFRADEAVRLHTYGWVTPGVEARLPVDVAKEQLLEAGLPTRPAAASETPAAAPPAAAPVEAQPAAAAGAH